MNKPFRIAFLVVLVFVSLFVLSITDHSKISNTKREALSVEQMMRSIFGNYDSELKLSIVDSTIHTNGLKHSISVPGAVFYNQHFINADSNECILLTQSSSYWSLAEYKKRYDEKNLIWLDTLQKLVLKKYELVCSDCHACGVAMGYYIFHKISGKWHLTKSFPKFSRMGAWGKAPAEIQVRKIGKDKPALFVETRGGSQGERIRRLSIYCAVDNSMKEVFNQQMYYSNEGAVGKPESLCTEEELKQLSEDDRIDDIRSCDYFEEMSEIRFLESKKNTYDIELKTIIKDYRSVHIKTTKLYAFSNGQYQDMTSKKSNNNL